jgi:cytosine/adenosine deaminase-related metal-dependent hydrolase
MSKTLLVKNATLMATMNEHHQEISDGGLFCRDNVIEYVGKSSELPQNADEIIDLSGHVLLPGLINTHHHMYQSLTRAVPEAQNSDLFNWLKVLYPIWSRLTPEMIKISTQVAMAELLLSGCTTSSDHLYIFPNCCRLDDSLEGAEEIGMRFHASRGSMSIGESQGGLPPDTVVEDEKTILKDCQRLIETFHDSQDFSLRRIVLAPCSPFSVSEALMRDSAQMARSYGISLHTHLAENKDDCDYSLKKFGKTPAQYAESLGWIGHDVWHAHCVELDPYGIELFGKTSTGIAHCPSSNMRLASGIAPLSAMSKAGVSIGLGVDGSASNDGAHMMAEARQALLLQRVRYGPQALSARKAIEFLTLGGAKVLNRHDIGALIPGKAADFTAFNLNDISLAGAHHDPIAALVFCAPSRASYTVVNGRVLVRKGELTSIELPIVIERHNKLAHQLVTNSRSVMHHYTGE